MAEKEPNNTTQKPRKASNKPRKNQLDKERELARLYYFNGDSQKTIAERIGVSPQTVNRWAKDGEWERLRAARTISRKELVLKMLQKINERLDSDDWTADEIIKAAAAVEKLDKKTNVVTMMEVFAAFGNWLAARMQIDPNLTPETVNVITTYQDIFIGEQMAASKVNFI
ncbi:MAG: helix-turn-helix domain-containing protein [Bacteroidales bacterium]|nr:helix-turn-helix domain-containing protein [Bacteroidales bacterium]